MQKRETERPLKCATLRIRNTVKQVKVSAPPQAVDNLAAHTGNHSLEHTKPHTCVLCIMNFGTIFTLIHLPARADCLFDFTFALWIFILFLLKTKCFIHTQPFECLGLCLPTPFFPLKRVSARVAVRQGVVQLIHFPALSDGLKKNVNCYRAASSSPVKSQLRYENCAKCAR